ncbi:MAG TPA: lipid II flippase MurJ, partial [Candidatus Limnocylindria bacterium]|nr:lipid II flippase MurJ [Candidatus Limnocylindria bacterium]
AVFFQYGLFDERSADLTSYALVFFAIGLAAHSAVQVLTRAFYAMHDTRVPVAWAIVAVAVNVPLMVALTGPMGIGGLALAISITASAEVLGLVWSLRARIRSIHGASILAAAWRSGVAAGAAALFMLGGRVLIEGVVPGLLEHGFGRLIALAAIGGAGVAIFVVVAAALRAPELDQLRRVLVRRLRRGDDAPSSGM